MKKKQRKKLVEILLTVIELSNKLEDHYNDSHKKVAIYYNGHKVVLYKDDNVVKYGDDSIKLKKKEFKTVLNAFDDKNAENKHEQNFKTLIKEIEKKL